MKLTKLRPETKESTVALRDTKSGEVVRFQHDSIEEAFKADLFFIRMETPELKDRVRLLNLKDGKLIERDGEHRVVIHNAVLSID